MPTAPMHLVAYHNSEQVLNKLQIVDLDHSFADILALVDNGKFSLHIESAQVHVGERDEKTIFAMTSASMVMPAS